MALIKESLPAPKIDEDKLVVHSPVHGIQIFPEQVKLKLNLK
jgi:hypothetical protein